MSTNTISVFNSTLAKTNAWLNEICNELGWDDPQKAYKALRVVMHELRDLLPAAEVSDLAAQLPMLVRGIYYEGWNPSKKTRLRSAEQFVDQVNSHFQDFEFTPETEFGYSTEITQAVLTVIASHVSAGEIEDVIACLPQGVRELWR